MIDTERAKKLVEGCAHGVTVVVPCVNCVATRMEKLLSLHAGDIKSAMRDEWQALEKSTKAAQERAVKLEKDNETLRMRIAKLQQYGEQMEKQVAAIGRTLNETRVRLDTEQALKNAGLRH